MAWRGPYFYNVVGGWDKEDTKFEVFRENWQDELVATFYDEGDAAEFVRLKNESFERNRK